MVAILGLSKDQITAAVQAMYAAVADAPSQGFHFPVGRAACLAVGYPEDLLNDVPQAAIESFAGVGYPFRADVIRPGDTVLDIGAGSGTDSFIASQKVGADGKVWALDITPDMRRKLQRTIEEAGIGNVETLEGNAEAIPLPDNSVDVVTSNGVLNLVPDKQQAFAEIFRVLRPGGRVQIADIVISRPVSLGGKSDPKLWAECVVGASVDEDYLQLFSETGFSDVQRLHEFDYFAHSASQETRRIASTLGARSIVVAMQRPAHPQVPGIADRLAHRLHPRRLKAIGSRGLWGVVATVAALIACYGTLAVVGILTMLGVGLTLDEGLWAVSIVGAAALAVVATAFNLPRHGRPWPLIAAGAATAVIAYVMFVSYDPVIEGLGFVLLVGAVILDLYLIYRAECLPPKTAAAE